MNTFFKNIPAITYEGKHSNNPFGFKWYDSGRKVGTKTMEEHLRFAVAYWHTFCGTGADPFGSPTIYRVWNESSDPMTAAESKLQAAFEFFTKLGVKYYCFHDRDLAPEGSTLADTNKNLETIAKKALVFQQETGIRLLWGTANLFSHPRYMNGAATNPDPEVFAYAAAQVKMMLDITLMLGGENYVLWGGREGYETLLNTDMKREREHLARFLSLAAEYAGEIGFQGQLLIEPKPKEPTKHQYDFDAAAVIGFLKEFGLDKKFKLNIEANHATLAGHSFQHELAFASSQGLLGSIDANRGDLLLGWDTDQFPLDLYDAVAAMLIVLNQGGLNPGGLNFDAKLRRASTDIDDLFHAHIGGMDTFARALLIADRILEDGAFEDFIAERYSGFDSDIGKRIETGDITLSGLSDFALGKNEPKLRSGRQEYLENMLNQYIFSTE